MSDVRGYRQLVAWVLFGYPLLYAIGYLSKSVPGSAAIWPAHALTFAGFVLLPLRMWPLVGLVVVFWELLTRPFFYWLSSQPPSPLAMTLVFAVANILTAAGPAAIARGLRLFRREEHFALMVSPLWIIGLFAGALPGALLGAAASARAAQIRLAPADVGLWLLASVLTIVTFGPMVFGAMLGFRQSTAVPARVWEGWAVTGMLAALFVCFAVVPWPSADPLIQPMLFAAPLVWLALRFSRRAMSMGVVLVALGVVCFAGYGIGIYRQFANASDWRDVVISIDVFLVIACGGALLVNLMTVKQRALLDELGREHAALGDHARALAAAEETARRKTAADLHDGIGQILAGQSMTLGAMRAHAHRPSQLAAMLDEAIDAAQEAQEGLRVMIQDLSPPELDEASLEQMLRWLAEFFENRFNFSVTWRVTGDGEQSRDRRRLIYRCVRELVMNARKHSQRRSADVSVHLKQQSVDISVTDEGIGFDAGRSDPPPGHGFGLSQLRERVRAAGGTLDLNAAPGAGCRASIRLPPPTPGAG